MKKNKGFTLVELLAVITIIGILSTIGTLSITKIIQNSKKDSFVLLAKKYIKTFREGLTNGDYVVEFINEGGYPKAVLANNMKCSLPPNGMVTFIPISEIKANIKESPYNKEINKGFVMVQNTEDINSTTETPDSYEYYFVGFDEGKNGIYTLTEESKINKKNIIKNMKSSSTSSSNMGYANISNINGGIHLGNKLQLTAYAYKINNGIIYQICKSN